MMTWQQWCALGVATTLALMVLVAFAALIAGSDADDQLERHDHTPRSG